MKGMKTFTVRLIILVSALVISSTALNSSTALQASSKGLNLHLTVDTNLESQDTAIITKQYGNEIYTHDGFLHTGRNEYTLQYPNNVVDSGPFVICIDVDLEWLYCGDGYNADEKRPENAYISAAEYGLNEKIREEEQLEQQEVDQSQSQSQSQDQTVIVCPANARCIIEQ